MKFYECLKELELYPQKIFIKETKKSGTWKLMVSPTGLIRLFEVEKYPSNQYRDYGADAFRGAFDSQDGWREENQRVQISEEEAMRLMLKGEYVVRITDGVENKVTWKHPGQEVVWFKPGESEL